MPLKFEKTEIEGVVTCEPEVLRDARGFFVETFHAAKYAEGGIDCAFVQDNRSRSQKGVLRGLHYQLRKPQAKLVFCLKGEIFDVAVDIRRGSPTFGKWSGAFLSEENHRQLFIPAGFAHGFCVLSDMAEIFYKCSAFYDKSDDRGLRWNDPDIGIDWPGGTAPMLSEKDKVQPLLKDLSAEMLPVFN
ncbi:MAG: dTDP-4-dehydrorhamnose 3,5-epimerase [Kiritimatiellae bacterium]|nr:dTDP-4-dehydrorhamnose 3,5-epimerase [Kiritimatiellia bacterium]